LANHAGCRELLLSVFEFAGSGDAHAEEQAFFKLI